MPGLHETLVLLKLLSFYEKMGLSESVDAPLLTSDKPAQFIASDHTKPSDDFDEVRGRWNLFLMSKDRQTRFEDRFGYLGVALINNATNELLIAHRGTKINFSNFTDKCFYI